MAKIIKVGSQNPTFTSQKIKKTSPIHTHRNSNEATNPFKFTNFEGKTLPFEFADVFEGFKPQSASKLRIIASSVAGSMNKIRSSVPESIINFVNKVRSSATQAWAYANSTSFTSAMSDAANAIKENSMVRRANEILNTEINIPHLDILASRMNGIKDGFTEGVKSISHRTTELGNMIPAKWNNMVSAIAFNGRQKYSNMSVAELEACFAAALAEGGSNE